MEPSSPKLDPESVRKLALRLYGEQALRAAPANVIFSTIEWVDRVIGNAAPEMPMRNDLIRRLGEIIKQREILELSRGL